MKSQPPASQKKRASSSISKSADSAAETIPLIEWIVGGLGLLLLISVISLLIYEGLTEKTTPPDIVLHATTIQAQSQGHVIEVQVHNLGGKPAAKVLVSGELQTPQGNTVEQAQTEIDFLPAGSHKNAGLFFTRDPNQHQVKLRPLGYEEP